MRFVMVFTTASPGRDGVVGSIGGRHPQAALAASGEPMSTLEKRHIPHTAVCALLGGVVVGALGLLFGNSPGLVIGVVVSLSTTIMRSLLLPASLRAS